MATEMEFCLLGPLLVRRGGTVMPVSPGKQRALLAALLLDANKVLSLDELAGVVWGAELPRSVRPGLHNIVMRLRRSLADADRSRVMAQPCGYQIRVETGELDIARFEALLAAGHEARRAGLDADAAVQFRAALALWRGPPLSGVSSQALELRDIPRLEEMRLQALEARLDTDLRLGRHAEAIIELKQLCAANPLRERLHALLMLALYRDGQQAGALAAFQAARTLLTDELGCEPGPELRLLQQQILNADPALTAVDTANAAGSAGGSAGADVGARRHARQPHGAVVPRQLPSAVPHLTGRASELGALTGLLDRSASAGDCVAIAAIAGTAGVGKTTLALCWAHRVADRFPDGQMHINLRGFGSAETAMTLTDAVRLLLDGLEVPAQRIPADLDAQVALYRSLLAGKRMLIVFDNARDPAQVDPLLPGSAGSMVLVTSRNQLTGLAAAHGASLLTLDVLTEQEASQMLARRIGHERARAEPAAVAELARLCARLPLALSIAAARAAARPRLAIADLTSELSDTGSRLDRLDTGDQATDVRTVFSWSYWQLSGSASGMFRLLGVHPGPDITAAAAASLAGVPQPEADRALSELARAHLVTESAPRRYTCHDLLRAYAGELAATGESEASRRSALHRILDYYVHTACAAALAIEPDRTPITVERPQPHVRPDGFTDRQQALDWLHSERDVLAGAINRAAADGFSAHAWQLPWAIAIFAKWYGYWHELATSQQLALDVLRPAGEPLLQIGAMRLLALAKLRLGAPDDAAACLIDGLEVARQADNSRAQAQLHADLAAVSQAQGHRRDALDHTEDSLRLFRAAGLRSCEADAINNLGWYHALFGNYEEALGHCQQAAAIYSELGNSPGRAGAFDSLGYAHHHLGHYAEAISCFELAIDIEGTVGDPHRRVEFLIHLGDSREAAGKRAAARHAWRQALDVCDELPAPAADQLRSRLARRLEADDVGNGAGDVVRAAGGIGQVD